MYELFNRSMSAGHFPSAFKDTFITPALKKPGLDATNVQSDRPISNLSVVSKLLNGPFRHGDLLCSGS